jgi:small-conductance mechanosensitive channel
VTYPVAALPGAGFAEVRLAVTVAMVVAVAAIAWVLRYRRADLGDWATTRVGAVTLAAVMLAVVVLAGATLVVLWRLVDVAVATFEHLEVGVDTVGLGVVTLAVLAGVYVATGVARRGVDEVLGARSHVSRHQEEVVYRVLQLSVYVVAGVVLLGLWNVDLGGLLVGAGFLGIVLGMAARQTLGSLIAGFVLMFARPFEIGDWVVVGDHEGIVTDITIVNTRVQTFDGEYVMIPNDTVGSSTITNRTRKSRLRVQVEVGVDYGTDVERAMEVARTAMAGVEEIMSVPAPTVVGKRFDDSAVVLECRFWIDKPSARRRWRAQTAVIAAVKGSFEDAGIEIPFPQRTHSVRPDEEGVAPSAGLAEEQPSPDGGER